MQGKLPKACCRTAREVDEADAVRSCFFSEEVFRDALCIKQTSFRNRKLICHDIGIIGDLII